MQTRQTRNDLGLREGSLGLSVRARSVRVAAGIAMVVVAAIAGNSQQTPPPRTPHPILLPEANHLPDINEQMKLNQQTAKKQNFDAANAERKRQIDDETAKLLILAKDLKTKVDNLGGEPLPPVLVREADVIEILANDVKVKMKMIVGGG
jgi:hypothetical protein